VVQYPLFPTDVWWDVYQIPDLLLNQGQFARIQHLRPIIFVHEQHQMPQLSVLVRHDHGRRQVIDDARVGFPFGLRALPGIFNQIVHHQSRGLSPVPVRLFVPVSIPRAMMGIWSPVPLSNPSATMGIEPNNSCGDIVITRFAPLEPNRSSRLSRVHTIVPYPGMRAR